MSETPTTGTPEQTAICERCQMRVPERLASYGIGVRGGAAARCAACTPVGETPEEQAANKAEVVFLRRKHWQKTAAPLHGQPAQDRACCEPSPDRTGRQCDKPAGHDGDHWTYGMNEKRWPISSQPTQTAEGSPLSEIEQHNESRWWCSHWVLRAEGCADCAGPESFYTQFANPAYIAQPAPHASQPHAELIALVARLKVAGDWLRPADEDDAEAWQQRKQAYEAIADTIALLDRLSASHAERGEQQ